MNGIKRFFEEPALQGLDSRALNGLKIICVGEPTKKLLSTYGIVADYIPNRFVAEGVIELLEPLLQPQDRVLIPRAKGARPLLVDRLKTMSSVTELHLYESVPTEVDWDYIAGFNERVDYITFTSASTARYFATHMKQQKLAFKNAKLISIGPITTQEMKKHGLEVHGEAKVHTIDGILECIQLSIKEDEDANRS